MMRVFVLECQRKFPYACLADDGIRVLLGRVVSEAEQPPQASS